MTSKWYSQSANGGPIRLPAVTRSHRLQAVERSPSLGYHPLPGVLNIVLQREKSGQGSTTMTAADDLHSFLSGDKFATVMADPPWRFQNRTGKIAPGHKRLARYPTMTSDEICGLPVADHLEDHAHCSICGCPTPSCLRAFKCSTLGASNTNQTSSGRKFAKMVAPMVVASASISGMSLRSFFLALAEKMRGPLALVAARSISLKPKNQKAICLKPGNGNTAENPMNNTESLNRVPGVRS